MRKTALLIGTVAVASCLSLSAAHAQESRAAKIKRLQAEQRIAEANARAALETQRAYEEAWRKTKSAAKGAACVAGSLYAGPAVGAACYGYNTFRKKK